MRKKTLAMLAAVLALCMLGGCAQENGAKDSRQQATQQEAPAATEAPEAAEAAAEKKAPAATADANIKQTRIGFFLDTVITLSAYTDKPELLDEGLALCGEYEKMLSRTIEGSDVWRINHADGKSVKVSPETAEILRTALRISELSGGAFDMTIAPVSTMWDFTSGAEEIPDAQAIADAVKLVDYRQVRIEGEEVTLPAGMMIDLGGIAKGYIADAVKAKLAGGGITSAILSFGGNIVAIGMKPDGSPWRVGIQDIDGKTGAPMMVSLNYGGSTVTSGIYERGFQKDGVTYHHILDSKTGWPVQNGLASVTIFSESSMMGDALSTAVFALGTEAGARMVESIDGVEALFIDRNRSASGTSGVGQYMADGEKYTVLQAAEAAPEAAEAGKPGPETGTAANTPEQAALKIQVRETDPAPGYVLVWGEKTAGFLALPEEGEKTQAIIQRQEDGSEWHNVILMTPEGFRMIEADCEGHDCIEEGEVTLENMQDRVLWNMVVCAPHRLTLYLYTKEQAVEQSKQWLGTM